MVEWYDLNTRQQAALLWSLVALLFLVLKFPVIRNSIRGMLVTFFKPAIFLSIAGLFLVTVAAFAGAVDVGRRLGTFETLPIVTSIIWSCTSGLSLMVSKITHEEGETTVVRVLTKTLAPAAVLSILLGFSVMGIWWELSTLPLVMTFGMVAAFSALKEELSYATRLSNFAIVTWTLAMISRAVYSLVSQPDAWISLVESLAYPLWLTVGALPYIYVLAKYDGLRFVIRCPSRVITADEYGDQWPLTVDRAKLCCRHNAVWLKVNRKRYGLNGTSYGLLERYGLRVRELEEIWRSNPEIEGLRVNIGPLIQDGLMLENRN